MKNPLSILMSLLLGICLSLYGPSGMARADGAVFAMEICANGVEKTVVVDAKGNPVEPAPHCADCLACCQATAATLPVIHTVAPSVLLREIGVRVPAVQNPVRTSRNFLPAPRGPPALRVFRSNALRLTAAEQSVDGQDMRSDGRPHSQDANA